MRSLGRLINSSTLPDLFSGRARIWTQICLILKLLVIITLYSLWAIQNSKYFWCGIVEWLDDTLIQVTLLCSLIHERWHCALIAGTVTTAWHMNFTRWIDREDEHLCESPAGFLTHWVPSSDGSVNDPISGDSEGTLPAQDILSITEGRQMVLRKGHAYGMRQQCLSSWVWLPRFIDTPS